MRGFRYKYGDKPLEGYTIQRAAGRGGFGEVYYAISDSGREVALKVVQGYEQIELRGVSQCMNLKSPHLVTIFDVKHNDEGTPFVIMEFVSGPSLRQLLDESPSGLGMQKTAFFLREIVKGLTYLHECGIVHRDLKPGNIFYENGYVKIGDYGLSKAMAASQHSGQTVTVGTVHYMAPEIGVGKYDRSIDIYALGVMLYEMLTGQVPYLGGSAGEILMKHMTAEPDVSNIEEPFASVIKKAMARDPQQRYQSVQEIVEAVFGAEHVQQSVSCFSPDSLSMIAQRVAERVAVGGGSATPPPLSGQTPPPRDIGQQVGAWADRFGQRMSEFGQRMGQWGDDLGRRMGSLGQRTPPAAGAPGEADPQSAPRPDFADPTHDPMPRKQRKVLALCVIAVIAGVMAILQPHGVDDPAMAAGLVALAIGGAALGIRLAQRRLMPQLAHESTAMQHLALGGLATVFMMLLCMPIYASAHVPANLLGGTAVAILVPLLLMDWMRCVVPERPERISFGHAFKAGLFGFIVSLLSGGSKELAIAVLAGTSLVVQVLAPWAPFAARRRKAQPEPGDRAADATPGFPPRPPAPPHQPQTLAAFSPAAVMPLPASFTRATEVPHWARILWLIGLPLLLSLGLMLVIGAGITNVRDEDLVAMIASGIGCMVLGGLCLAKASQRTFHSWWQYLVKPLLMFTCLETILVSALMLGNVRLGDDETLIAIFFIVFPAMLFLILVFARFGSSPRRMSPAFASPMPFPPPQDGSRPQEFPPAPASSHLASPAGLPSDTRSIALRAGSGLLCLIGGLLLLTGMVLGLAHAADIPAMVAIGLPDPSLRNEVARGAAELGIQNWVEFSRTLLMCLAGNAFFFAAVFLMISRRSSNLWHMIRVPLAIIDLIICLGFLEKALAGHWAAAAGQTFPAALEVFLRQANRLPLIPAGVFALLGIITLLYTPKWGAPVHRRSHAQP